MGSWGPGLYSNDLSEDLKPAIGSVLQVPLSIDEVVEILLQDNICALDVDDDDHTSFWLVLADQFEKRGIRHADTMAKALHLVDSGTDLEVMRSLGMEDSDLKRRDKAISELANRLRSPRPEKLRKTLKAPQPLLAQKGDIICYPVMAGRCLNPYLKSTEQARPWHPDGWRYGAVALAEHAYEYLAWYAILLSDEIAAIKPVPDSTAPLATTGAVAIGTCSKIRWKRLGIEIFARSEVELSPAMLPKVKGYGLATVTNDVCISNMLSGESIQFNVI